MSTAFEQQKAYDGIYSADVEYNSPPYIQVHNLKRTFQKQIGSGLKKQKEELLVLNNIIFPFLKESSSVS